MRRIVLLAVSYSVARGSEVDDVTFEPAYGYWDDDSYGYMIDDGFCAWQCDPEYISDGECDEMCNVPECEFDGVDCFHGYGECYTQADGSDYRGAVNVTEGGLTCQAWSQQWPQRRDRIHTNYPHGGLGGHNSCRNPDGETGPWCFTTDPNVRWQLCTIPPPQGTCAGHHAANRTAPPPRPASDAGSGEQSSSDMYDDYNMDYPYPPWELSYDIFPVVFAPEVSSPIELNTMITGSVEEHTYVFYEVEIPQSVQEVKVVVVPEEGDPDLYVSFDNPFPTGANYTFLSDNYGVEEWTLGRYNYLFCGAAGTEAACTMYLSILAYDEHSTFSLVVYGVEEASADDAPSTLCAPGCEWLSLGDGTCNQQCDVEECFFDRGDCACDSAESADCTDGCPVSCKPEWIGDHYCDEACFRASCQWDKHDCLKKGETPCADDCLPTSLGDGECDAACNVESCNFDIDDCFHNNNECYERQETEPTTAARWPRPRVATRASGGRTSRPNSTRGPPSTTLAPASAGTTSAATQTGRSGRGATWPTRTAASAGTTAQSASPRTRAYTRRRRRRRRPSRAPPR